ncbi:MAG: HAMP domain-containing histidine kinase [Clostridia bacterium]|nr:HAMP domain-containing histidine kinase [Clostridia bacterium]
MIKEDLEQEDREKESSDGKSSDKKSSDKKQKGIFLAAGILITSVCASFSTIFSYYGSINWYWSYMGKNFFGTSAVILMIIAVIAGIASVADAVLFLRAYPPSKEDVRYKADRMWSEAAIILCLVSGIIWRQMFSFDKRIDEVKVWGAYIVNHAGTAVWVGILLLALLVLFYGSILIMARKFYLGIWKESSLIYKIIREYKERTPLEKRIQNSRKMWLAAQLICIAGALICIIFWNAYFYLEGYWVAAVVFILAGLGICLKQFFSNKVMRDAGILAEKIRRMENGEDFDETVRLPESSFLYEASNALENIDSAMRKSVEKQVQAERLKIDLITNMSHDLKTPLTSMVGYTDLLKKSDLNAEAKDYVEVISVKQEQLKNMIQDLFELSKATSGSEQLNLEVLDMRRLLEQTIGDMEDAIRASEQIIRTRFSAEPLYFIGDNGKMYRVVQNLLENALKYSLPDTRIYLEAEKKNDQIQMSMKNIASYEMDFAPDEIMERFVRGDKSRSTSGHGLGLAIASSFVKNMGGELQVDIDGDLFKVTMHFPCAQPDK